MHVSASESRAEEPSPRPDPAEADLIGELSGRAVPAARTPEQCEDVYRRVLRTLLCATTYPDPAREPGEKSGEKGSPPPRPPKMILEELIVAAGAPGRESQRGPLVRAMLAELDANDRLNDRIYLLRELAVVGREEAVPALARLLSSAEPALRHYALGALERNTSAEAGKALVAALGQQQEAAWLVAVIQALGRRREKAAVGLLSQRLAGPDRQIAEAAAMSLGSIATDEAAQALAAASKGASAVPAAVLGHARLLCADRMAGRGEKVRAHAIYREIHEQASDPLLKTAAQAGIARTGGK
jgi:HEAT repeat protein